MAHNEAIMFNLTIPIWVATLIGGLYVLPIKAGVILAIALLIGFPVVLAIQYHKGIDPDIVKMYSQGVKLLPNILREIGKLIGKS